VRREGIQCRCGKGVHVVVVSCAEVGSVRVMWWQCSVWGGGMVPPPTWVTVWHKVCVWGNRWGGEGITVVITTTIRWGNQVVGVVIGTGWFITSR